MNCVVSVFTLFVFVEAAFVQATLSPNRLVPVTVESPAASVKGNASGDSRIVSLHLQAERAAQLGNYDDVRGLYAQEAKLFLASGHGAEAAELNIEIGELSQVQGVFPASEAAYKKGLDLFARYAESPTDLRRVIAMDDLGWLYITWGRTAEGARLMEQAKINADRADPNNPEQIRHLDTQAAFLMVIRKYSDAQKQWTRALEVGDRNYGPDSPKYANILVHYGQGRALCGQYKIAEELFKRYLAIEDDRQVMSSTSQAVAAGELARVYSHLHRYSDAKAWFDKAMKLSNEKPDQAPLIRSMILSYLGDYSMARDDWSNAEKQYREALTIQQRVLGENRAVAASMVSLSNALRKLHLKQEAKELVARAKEIVASRRNPADNATVDVVALRRE